MKDRTTVPNPCFVLRHPHGGQSRRVKEGILVFSTKDKAAEHVENFFPAGESARIISLHVGDLRSSYTCVVIDFTSPDQDKVTADISEGTGQTMLVVGF